MPRQLFTAPETTFWTLRNGLAVCTYIDGKEYFYDLPSLQAAVQNVKKNRNWYATDKAYEQHLSHFKTGLSLFKSSQNT